ncbi:hypothetical protein AAVH_37518 [Aphelenchoides avenae]|nr:hypothetical protein AAVH_37518 [Aphelenchus avenae]
MSSDASPSANLALMFLVSSLVPAQSGVVGFRKDGNVLCVIKDNAGKRPARSTEIQTPFGIVTKVSKELCDPYAMQMDGAEQVQYRFRRLARDLVQSALR